MNHEWLAPPYLSGYEPLEAPLGPDNECAAIVDVLGDSTPRALAAVPLDGPAEHRPRQDTPRIEDDRRTAALQIIVPCRERRKTFSQDGTTIDAPAQFSFERRRCFGDLPRISSRQHIDAEAKDDVLSAASGGAGFRQDSGKLA